MAYNGVYRTRSMSSISTMDPTEYQDGCSSYEEEATWEPKFQQVWTRDLDHRMVQIQPHSPKSTQEPGMHPSSNNVDVLPTFLGLERTMTRGPDGKMVVVETFRGRGRTNSFGQTLKTKYRRVASRVSGALRRAMHFGQKCKVDKNDPALTSTFQGAYYQQRQRERANSRA